MPELFLREGIQHIALVLGIVHGFFEKIPPGILIKFHPRIVPGDDIIKFHFVHSLHHRIKFQKPVAVDAGIRGRAALVAVRKALHDILPEPVGEIEHIMQHPQLRGNELGILHVTERAAGFFPWDPRVLVVKELHGRAHAFVACL